MHTVDPCSFTPYGDDIVRTRGEISCSFVATALTGVSAALFEDRYGPFEWTNCKCASKHDPSECTLLILVHSRSTAMTW